MCAGNTQCAECAQKWQNLPTVGKAQKKSKKPIGKTVLANEASITAKIPFETIVGSAIGSAINHILSTSLRGDLSNSKLQDDLTLAGVQAGLGAGLMFFSKGEKETAAGLTIATGAVAPLLRSFGIGDGIGTIGKQKKPPFLVNVIRKGTYAFFQKKK